MSSGSRRIRATRCHGTTWRSATSPPDNRKSLSLTASEALRLSPKDKFANANLRTLTVTLGRYDEARAVIEKAAAQGLGTPTDAFSLYTMAFMRDDKAGMQRAVELGKGPSVEPIMLFIEGQGQCALGKVQTARQSFAQGISLARKVGPEGARCGDAVLNDASCLAEIGNQTLARQVAFAGACLFE